MAVGWGPQIVLDLTLDILGFPLTDHQQQEKIRKSLVEVAENLNFKPKESVELSTIKISKIQLIIISTIIWIEFLTLVRQTKLMLEARKATIDVEVLNLTELAKPIRKIEWKTVYEDSLKTTNQFRYKH